MKTFFRTSYFAIILLFIYIPIAIMILFSFNKGESVFLWSGFSTEWYDTFFNNSPLVKSIITSLFVAVVSTIVSLVIGVLAGVGLSKCRRITRNSWLSVANIPLINADVITAVSLMIIFLIAGMKFGILTLIFAHISFNVPYVLMTIMPRFAVINKTLLAASCDLGANSYQTFFKVILPILKPAIIAAAAIAFAMSFDDFIISYFTGGGDTNVSTFIYSAKKVRPYVYALGSLMVLVILVLIIFWNAIKIWSTKSSESVQKIKDGKYKLKQISHHSKKLMKYYDILNTQTEVIKTKKLQVWMKYAALKIKLKWLQSRNLNSKSSKLMWKIEQIREEFKQERKIKAQYQKNLSRLVKLENILQTAVKASSREEKVRMIYDKLVQKNDQLKSEIDWYNSRDQRNVEAITEIKQTLVDYELEKDEFQKLNDKVALIKLDKKIKTTKKQLAILEEGKQKYRLRKTIEKLAELKAKNIEAIQVVSTKITNLRKKVYLKKSINQQIDKKLHINDQVFIDNHLAEKKATIMNKTLDFYRHLINFHETELAKIEGDLLKKQQRLNAIDLGELGNNSWWSRSWKWMLTLTLSLGAIGGLTTAYIKNNIYDLVIANWGSYIDPSLITKFENQYGVKINYQEYDSNESLYNKLYTFNYDVMVPSDYMVQRLAVENKLEQLDWTKLKAWDPNSNNGQNLDIDYELSAPLVQNMKKSIINIGDNTKTILDYSVPYFWGDLVIVINPTDSMKDFLNQNNIQFDPASGLILNQDQLSWNLIKTAADAGKNVALNFDVKNVYQFVSQALWSEGNYNSLDKVDQATSYLSSFLTKRNVSLQGDELITTIALGNFDIAFMYSGDAAWSNLVYNHLDDEDSSNDQNVHFIFGRPNKVNPTNNQPEGTNIYSDDMVIAQNSTHKDLAYKFINFIYENMLELASWCGAPGPTQKSLDEMSGLTSNTLNVAPSGEYNDYAGFEKLYLPSVLNTEYTPELYQYNSINSAPFFFNQNIDDYMMDRYNSLIAGKN